MNSIKYLFISRPSSHYRYYQKLVSFLGDGFVLRKLKRLVLPRLSYVSKAKTVDIDELVKVHIERKKVRHPILNKSPILSACLTSIYKIIEFNRATYYFAYFEKHKVQNLVIWNGQKQPNKTPYIVAKKLGIQCHLFENGLLPGTTVLDPVGVNALNSMPRTAEFYLNWQAPEKALSQQLDARENHKNRVESELLSTLPERYVFVPFQVPNDTQIICQSPWIKSMESFYEALEASLSALPENTAFVIKEHPSWPRSFSQLHNKNSRIIFANGNNTQQLIEGALAVLTINSTVGIEALLLNKKVITLGNSFLNIEGLVKHATNINELKLHLANLASWQVDDKLRSQFLLYLKEEYLLSQRWDKLTDPESHFKQVQSRLEHPYTP